MVHESRGRGLLGTVDFGCDFSNAENREWYVPNFLFEFVKAYNKSYPERAKVRKAMETMLLKTAMKIVSTVNREKDHIPPITTSETNPFPYQISINPKGDGWGARVGMF